MGVRDRISSRYNSSSPAGPRRTGPTGEVKVDDVGAGSMVPTVVPADRVVADSSKGSEYSELFEGFGVSIENSFNHHGGHGPDPIPLA